MRIEDGDNGWRRWLKTTEESSTSPTCSESIDYTREREGHLVGSFTKEDVYAYCLATALNFDLPFGMIFHHGQVLVKIRGHIQELPVIKIQGIEDTSKNLILK